MGVPIGVGRWKALRHFGGSVVEAVFDGRILSCYYVVNVTTFPLRPTICHSRNFFKQGFFLAGIRGRTTLSWDLIEANVCGKVGVRCDLTRLTPEFRSGQNSGVPVRVGSFKIPANSDDRNRIRIRIRNFGRISAANSQNAESELTS